MCPSLVLTIEATDLDGGLIHGLSELLQDGHETFLATRDGSVQRSLALNDENKQATGQGV